MDKGKKLSLGTCMTLSMGSIIGAGIFSTTPVAVEMVGNSICLAFILAACFLVLKMIPQVVTSSSLPANGANYMHLSRLVHPVFGMTEAFNWILIGTMNIATMSITFATYFCILFPAFPPKIAAIGCCLLFTIIATFGAKISGMVQNICVAILFVALGVYVFMGIQNITAITLIDVIKPTVELGAMWAVVGILNNTLMGANVVMGFADEIENPSRTIPIAFLGGTFIVAAIYALIGYVTVGVVPWNEVTNMADVAGSFLSPGLLAFFITGGALLAVVTSINGSLMMYSRAHFAAARDGLFPELLRKTNKFNAPYGAIWFNSAITMAVLCTSINLRDVIKITSVPGLVLGPLAYLAIFQLPKKYPNCYKNAFLKIPHKVTCSIAVLATVLSVSSGGSVISSMQPKHWISMILFYVSAVIYTILRMNWLKKNKHIDLFEVMRAAHEPWQEMEDNYLNTTN